MTLSGILSSPSQRRSFLLASFCVLAIAALGIFILVSSMPNSQGWNALTSLLISIVASGVFAITSGLYISYFFVDPNDVTASTILLPKDVSGALEDIAATATEYRIFVRTGRHFRADILPILIKQARRRRLPLRVEVILLDFRDINVCERYSNFRRTSSFDRNSWTFGYVQNEIAATILALIQASNDNQGIVDIHLYLSKRLSNFRIEGSASQLLVTREDPTDPAFRYSVADRHFSAYATEFKWIRDDAHHIPQVNGTLPSFSEMFDNDPSLSELVSTARNLINADSPYAR